MLNEEGLENVFARHARHGEATRRAVARLGARGSLRRTRRSTAAHLTAVLLPAGHDADALRRKILEAFDMSLGTGLGQLAGKVFRIGHLGHFNDLTLAGTLAGVEMGLQLGRRAAPAGRTAARARLPRATLPAPRRNRESQNWPRQVKPTEGSKPVRRRCRSRAASRS